MNQKKKGAGQGALGTTQFTTNDSASPAGMASDIVVRRGDGELVVDSLTISREFDRNHKDVLRALDSLITDGTLNERNFAPVEYADAKGEMRRMIELTERGALIAMPFIGGRRAREGQVRLVNAFIALRERAVPAAIDLTNPETLRGLLQSLAGQSLQLQQQVAVLSPKADALDRLGAAEGSLCITDAAKNLKVRPMALFKWLASSEWIYRRGATWIGYQAAIMRGLLEHRVTTIQRDDGTEKAATQVRITPKGLALLAKKMPEASQ